MGALDRANHDEQQGDLGAARVRLISLAITSPYDPGLYERIARLCCRMGDKAEAGKWYFLCDSADSEGPACIDRFRARHGGDMRAILFALPKSMLAKIARGPLPRAVSERFAALDPNDLRAALRGKSAGRLPSGKGCSGNLILLVVCGVVLVLAAFGAIGLIRMLRD